MSRTSFEVIDPHEIFESVLGHILIFINPFKLKDKKTDTKKVSHISYAQTSSNMIDKLVYMHGKVHVVKNIWVYQSNKSNFF